jgi:AcrR family transcriptional regulator
MAAGGGLMPRGSFDRSARRASTRASLLEAAASVYARRGFSGATLDEVAGEAGFTKGAVYDHFGSKENLLLALWEEYLAGQITEQMALFDRGRDSWERPLAGSARWMELLAQDPDPFRLFVELWVYAQREERLRSRLAAALAALGQTFANFAETTASEAGLDPPSGASARFGTVTLALGIGLPMLRLLDPESVPTSLLGAVMSILVRAAEADPATMRMLAGADGPPARQGAVA